MNKCQYCGKEGKDKRHESLCGKNPNRRGKKKGYRKNNIHKTTGKKTVTITPPAAGQVLPAAPVESKILKEINLNKEFENMSEKFKGGSDAEKEKKYKYKCECGEYFNIPAKNEAGENCCPFCGK